MPWKMTEVQAIARADRRAKETGEVQYVVWEDGYQVADDVDLDTFFAGISPQHIIYCTADAFDAR